MQIVRKGVEINLRLLIISSCNCAINNVELQEGCMELWV